MVKEFMRLLLAYIGILAALSLLFGVFRLDIYMIREYFAPQLFLFLEFQFINMIQITILLLSIRIIKRLHILKNPFMSFVLGFSFSSIYFPISVLNYSKVPILDSYWAIFVIFPIFVFAIIITVMVLAASVLKCIKSR
jgi:hypothetical protein